MSRERPILFSAPMVRAILEGRKTQTRRAVKLFDGNHADKAGCFRRALHGESGEWVQYCAAGAWTEVRCPYGAVGDQLWVTQGASFDRTIPFLDRYWSRVYKTDGCWEWFGHTNRKHYGVIKRDLKSVAVHRVAWELSIGAIPEDMHVLHKCDVPWCVNPEHLWLGTNEQNIADKMSKGRHRAPAGESQRDSLLSEVQVSEIRALYWEQDVYQKDIAAKFGIHQSQVSKIVNNKQWNSREELPTVGRRTLEVTGVRVERLQEISQADCIAEGMSESTNGFLHHVVADYRKLWGEINGRNSWDANPWVWVIEFKRITP